MVRPRTMKYCDCCKTNVILNHSNTKYCRNCGRTILDNRKRQDARHFRVVSRLKQEIIDLKKELMKK